MLAVTGGHFPIISHLLLETLAHVAHALLHANLSSELVSNTGLVRGNLLIHSLGTRLAWRFLWCLCGTG